jgi:hypothetical protein
MSIEQVNNYKDIIKQPLNIPLFYNQQMSIKSMEKLELDQHVAQNDGWFKETRLGVNADACGSGKSLTVIGLIARDRMEWDLETPFVSEAVTSKCSNLLKYRKVNRYIKIPVNLILVHDMIIKQWENECLKSELNFTTVRVDRDLKAISAEKYDIVFVTPNMYNKLVSSYKNYAWKRFIFDQPCSIKVSNMKPVYAGFTWFLTPYYTKIITKHKNCPKNSFIRNIIDDDSDIFNGIIIQNSGEPEGREPEGREPDEVNHMAQIKLTQVKYVSNVTNRLNSSTVKTMINNNDFDSIAQVLNCKISNVAIKNNCCNICLDVVINPIIEPSCQQAFCSKCILQWLNVKLSCPLCRSSVKPENLIYVKNPKNMTPIQQTQTKLDAILSIVSNSTKCIIYSSNDNLYQEIISHLHSNSILSKEIKGNYKSKTNVIEAYTKGSLNVILFNTMFLSIGVNLQETTDLIICDGVDKNVTHQLTNKITRTGQQNYLNIHQLSEL